MEMTETGDGLCFQNNYWAKFVEDNSITNGDCLVFSYDGYGMFDFVLFDQFGCEKIVVRDAQPQVKKEYIPMDVIKDHNIALPPTLILRDPRGREWKSDVKSWRDGRTWLTSGGWQSLCRVNLVDKDDKCICEFVCSNTNGMLLQVTIVRGQTTKNVK
nr:B3 domain-containing protein REM20-like [Ipomoea batatas]GME14874.1 B3 domain-containing protein REM20-like [Ipomoea batatas]